MSDETPTETTHPEDSMQSATAAQITTAASIDEASDLYLEARQALDHDSPEWAAVVDAMQARFDAEPAREITPLVVLG